MEMRSNAIRLSIRNASLNLSVPQRLFRGNLRSPRAPSQGCADITGSTVCLWPPGFMNGARWLVLFSPRRGFEAAVAWLEIAGWSSS